MKKVEEVIKKPSISSIDNPLHSVKLISPGLTFTSPTKNLSSPNATGTSPQSSKQSFESIINSRSPSIRLPKLLLPARTVRASSFTSLTSTTSEAERSSSSRGNSTDSDHQNNNNVKKRFQPSSRSKGDSKDRNRRFPLPPSRRVIGNSTEILHQKYVKRFRQYGSDNSLSPYKKKLRTRIKKTSKSVTDNDSYENSSDALGGEDEFYSYCVICNGKFRPRRDQYVGICSISIPGLKQRFFKYFDIPTINLQKPLEDFLLKERFPFCLECCSEVEELHKEETQLRTALENFVTRKSGIFGKIKESFNKESDDRKKYYQLLKESIVKADELFLAQKTLTGEDMGLGKGFSGDCYAKKLFMTIEKPDVVFKSTLKLKPKDNPPTTLKTLAVSPSLKAKSLELDDKDEQKKELVASDSSAIETRDESNSPKPKKRKRTIEKIDVAFKSSSELEPNVNPPATLTILIPPITAKSNTDKSDEREKEPAASATTETFDESNSQKAKKSKKRKRTTENTEKSETAFKSSLELELNDDPPATLAVSPSLKAKSLDLEGIDDKDEQEKEPATSATTDNCDESNSQKSKKRKRVIEKLHAAFRAFKSSSELEPNVNPPATLTIPPPLPKSLEDEREKEPAAPATTETSDESNSQKAKKSKKRKRTTENTERSEAAFKLSSELELNDNPPPTLTIPLPPSTAKSNKSKFDERKKEPEASAITETYDEFNSNQKPKPSKKGKRITQKPETFFKFSLELKPNNPPAPVTIPLPTKKSVKSKHEPEKEYVASAATETWDESNACPQPKLKKRKRESIKEKEPVKIGNEVTPSANKNAIDKIQVRPKPAAVITPRISSPFIPKTFSLASLVSNKVPATASSKDNDSDSSYDSDDAFNYFPELKNKFK